MTASSRTNDIRPSPHTHTTPYLMPAQTAGQITTRVSIPYCNDQITVLTPDIRGRHRNPSYRRKQTGCCHSSNPHPCFPAIFEIKRLISRFQRTWHDVDDESAVTEEDRDANNSEGETFSTVVSRLPLAQLTSFE